MYHVHVNDSGVVKGRDGRKGVRPRMGQRNEGRSLKGGKETNDEEEEERTDGRMDGRIEKQRGWKDRKTDRQRDGDA